MSQIDATSDLSERLQHYREFIGRSVLDSELRLIKGIDRPLLEILDRCLSVDPERRYPNIQTVMDAIQTRDTLRDRKPLIILGLVGPLLFLLVTILFAWRSHDRAVSDADQLLLQRTQAVNGFAADFVSEAVARRIESYFRAVQEISARPGFQSELLTLLSDPEVAPLLAELQGRDPGVDSDARERLVAHPLRQSLQERMELLLSNPYRPEIASWFVTDQRGIHVAAAFDTPAETSPVGGDYSFRTYFHGQPADLPPSAEHHPITQTHLSAVFQSTATRAWKVAISTPVMHDGRILGVVALTVELGRLGELLGGDSDLQQFNVLVDGRAGENRGVILQHPLFARMLRAQRNLDAEFSTSARYRVPLDDMREGEIYRDPLGQHAEGQDFRGNWIAAKRAVSLSPAESDGGASSRGEIDTGLIVLVQEDYDSAARAVHQLGESLLSQGIVALSSVVLLVVVLWYSVARALGDPNETIRRQGGVRSPTTTVQNMETIELPQRLQRPPKNV